MHKLIRRCHAEKGFTMVELIVVITILGILAVVAIPNLSSFIGNGKNEAATTELSIVQTCVVAYMEDHGGNIDAASGVTGTGGMLDFYVHTPLHGTYSWDDQGHVTQTAYP